MKRGIADCEPGSCAQPPGCPAAPVMQAAPAAGSGQQRKSAGPGEAPAAERGQKAPMVRVCLCTLPPRRQNLM